MMRCSYWATGWLFSKASSFPKATKERSWESLAMFVRDFRYLVLQF
ncbi:hypothetical protein VCHA38O210_80095 [Vibrio chagasii]|nr:hypothetical protein VCHA38O210_80095 [Vibrio chagasii]